MGEKPPNALWIKIEPIRKYHGNHRARFVQLEMFHLSSLRRLLRRLPTPPAKLWRVLLLSVVALRATAQLREAKSVLMVEDQISAPAVEAVAREFESQLTAKSLDPVEFFRESLDTFLIPEGDYQADVRRWYEKKYLRRKLDLIVTIGPASHDFLVKEHAQYFTGVPVVFLLDIKPDSETPPSDPDFTGVWMQFDPVATLDVARQLLPATKHVAVVAGSGMFDQLFIKSVKIKLQRYQGVDITYLTDLDLASLLKKVGSLSSDTVILYLTVTKDRKERHMFVAYTLPLVSAAADVPVFGLMDQMVGRGSTAGRGIVGGRVTDLTESAPIAAELASRVLRGAKPDSILQTTVADRYVFDWKLLQKWRLDASRLPPRSTIINRDPNVWQRYKKLILAVLVLIVLQAGVVVYLLIERRKRLVVQRALEHDIAERKRAEAALTDLSVRLINAQEEERRRLARELHDDINQRLAMLAIDLEKTAMSLPAESNGAVGHLQELSNRTSDIGGDLHRLSHNLHSSTLDVLGLNEGVRSLCAEFTEQQDLQVEFVSHDVPRRVPPNTSLCLFRIAQEGLRNVKKHSAARRAVVQLVGNGDEITLSITDTGSGFDPRDVTFKAGLGLRSMQERLRAVGGNFEIHSRRGGPTRIIARAPL